MTWVNNTKTLLFISFVICSWLFGIVPVSASVAPAKAFNSGLGINTGLVGYWTLDSTSMRDNVLDFSPSYATGSLFLGSSGSRNTTTVQGVMGQAYDFDGINDYINLGRPTQLRFNGNKLTISAWVKMDSYPPSGFPDVIGKVNSFSPFGGYQLNTTSSGTWSFFMNLAGVWNGVTSVGALNPSIGAWHLVTGVYDGTNAYIYFDGALNNSTPLSGNIVDVGADVYMGVNSAGSTYIDGKLDDVRIYNRALSADEVTRLYRLRNNVTQGTTVKSNPNLVSSLVGHWTFDGPNLLQNVQDISSSFATGSLILGSGGNTGTTTVGGRIGQALVFDGTDDTIITSSIPLFISSYTISAWVYTSDTSISRDIFTYADNAGNTCVLLEVTSSSLIRFLHRSNCNTGGGDDLNGSNTIMQKNRWYHILITRNSATKTMSIYVNGKFDKSLVGTDVDIAATRRINIGSLSNSSRFWKGYIDDVRAYSRSLSEDEITRIYNLGATSHISTTVKSSDTLKNGLVGHWTFDGPQMIGLVDDISGSFASGTLVSNGINSIATTSVPGRLGQALNFSGNTEYVQLRDRPQLNITGNMAISLWAKFTASQLNIPFIARWGTDESYMMEIDFTNANRVGFFTRVSNVNKAAISSKTYNDGKWHHYVGVFDGTNVRLYVDGGVENITGDATSGPIDSPAQNVTIGVYNSLGASTFKGQLDDIRVYNRALSLTEVKRLYDLGK